MGTAEKSKGVGGELWRTDVAGHRISDPDYKRGTVSGARSAGIECQRAAGGLSAIFQPGCWIFPVYFAGRAFSPEQGPELVLSLLTPGSVQR